MNKLSQWMIAGLLITLCTVGAPTAQAGEPASPAYVAPRMQHAEFGSMKVVLPLTSADMVDMKLRNIGNALAAVARWGGHLEVRVVMYAGGVTWLASPSDRQKAALDRLRAQGVRFLVCDNTLQEKNIDFHTLHGVVDADIVPSGFAEVAYLLSSQGFVVDPAL